MFTRYGKAIGAILMVALIVGCGSGAATAPPRLTQAPTQVAEILPSTADPTPTAPPTVVPSRTPTPTPEPLPSPTAEPSPTPGREPALADVQWVQTYGGAGEQVGGHVLLADDGGYYVLGTNHVQFEPEPQADIYLLRTDASGGVLWEQTYGGEGVETGQGLLQASDGRLVIVGSASSRDTEGQDIQLLKVDEEGHEIWSRTYSGPLDELAGTILETADGGYLLVGNVVDPSDVIGDPGAAGYAGEKGRSNIYLVRTDVDGTELWSQQYESDENIMAFSGLLTPDGGALVVGTVLAYPGPDDDIYLLRVDGDGAELWIRVWREGRASGYQIVETGDGNYLVTGPYGPLEEIRTTADFLFLKIDPEGNELWFTTFGDPDMVDYASVLARTDDGGIIAAGERVRDLYSGDSDIDLVKIDPGSGQLLSEEIIDTNAHSMLVTLLEHPNGGCVIGGAMAGRQGFDIILIKTVGTGEVTSAPPVSEELAELIAQIDEVTSSQEEASGAVLIAQDGEPVFAKAFGLAERSSGTPNQVDTKFNLASMGKMFTGVAIMQLVEQNLLSVEDRIIEHLPEYPNAEIARQVTIHQLLTHTSGMGNVFTEEYDAMSKDELRTVEAWLPLFVDTPLQFEPGTEMAYSNAGYVVLGLIIEAVSGQSYYDYVRDHIFLPGGMMDTDAYERDVLLGETIAGSNLATGYTRQIEGANELEGLAPNTELLPAKGFPAGGSYSTVEDLLRFGNALLTYQLLSPESTEILLQGKVEFREGVQYAYGFFDEDLRGYRAVGHTGGFPGICDFFYVYPDLGLTIIVLSNSDGGCIPALEYLRQ
jgi:CubicO group peptidase (beta-lactamase class C family)/outer membrane protein assembly factor BamB